MDPSNACPVRSCRRLFSFLIPPNCAGHSRSLSSSHSKSSFHSNSPSLQTSSPPSSTTLALRILGGSTGRSSSPVFTSPILCTTPNPLVTRPKIVCFPSSHGVGASVILWLSSASQTFQRRRGAPTRIDCRSYSAHYWPYSAPPPRYVSAKGVSRPRISRRRRNYLLCQCL